MGGKLTPEEEKKKYEIFAAMSPKRQQMILRKGYENWDPFQPPKEPFDKIEKTILHWEQIFNLSQQFLKENNLTHSSPSFIQGAIEICKGILEKDERYQGMFEFCLWYNERKEKGF